MDNPEKLATVGTQHTFTRHGGRPTKQKAKKMSNTHPIKKTGMNPSALEDHAVPTSNKTLAMLV